MNNPYEVLGVTQNATDDEVKTAYRNLAKKYHPDNYSDSPLSDVAEQKMKEVNEAYDTIMDMRKNGGSNSSYQNGRTYGYGSGNTSYSGRFREVRLYIQQNRISEAQQLLDAVDIAQRDAEWYFLQGMIFNRKGWAEQAFTNFQTAVNMDPTNAEYAAAFKRVNRYRSYNSTPYNTYDNSSCSCCDICTGLICADCLCDCMRCC